MSNSFAGSIIMVGIVICLAAAIWLTAVERREEKRVERFDARNREMSRKKVSLMTRSGRYEAWKNLEINEDPRKDWRRAE